MEPSASLNLQRKASFTANSYDPRDPGRYKVQRIRLYTAYHQTGHLLSRILTPRIRELCERGDRKIVREDALVTTKKKTVFSGPRIVMNSDVLIMYTRSVKTQDRQNLSMEKRRVSLAKELLAIDNF